LTERGCDPNTTTNNGQNALHLAASCGNVDIVKYLIEKGARNTMDNNRFSPLESAEKLGHRDAAEYLRSVPLV